MTCFIMLLYSVAVLIISYVQESTCFIGAPGVPVPGAELISQMFAKRIKLEGSIMNYMKNPNVKDTDEVKFAEDNLDISVLDIHNFRKLISLGKKHTEDNYRRQRFFTPYRTRRNRLQTAGFKKHLRENPNTYATNHLLVQYDRHIEKLFMMMKQSIYGVRDKVERTRKMRVFYYHNPSYKIAMLDSAIQHYMRKMDFYSARISKWGKPAHFLWYLILYEKVLQCNIDINYAVERIFKIHEVFSKVQSLVPDMPKGFGGVDIDAYKNSDKGLDPNILEKMKEKNEKDDDDDDDDD